MLERNRGARRDRTHTKKEHAYRALRNYLTAGKRSVCWGCFRPVWSIEHPWQAPRYFLRNEGRGTRGCPECRHGCEPPDWCFAGAARKQKRLHNILNADYDAWVHAESNRKVTVD